MYKIDRRGGAWGGGGAKNCSLDQTRNGAPSALRPSDKNTV